MTLPTTAQRGHFLQVTVSEELRKDADCQIAYCKNADYQIYYCKHVESQLLKCRLKKFLL
jgi:hypothetical protein